MSPHDGTAGRFADRVAIITGSGRGIGFQVARRLLAEGASVVVNDIDAERLAGAAEVLGSPERVMPSLTDVTKPSAVSDMVTRTVERFGRIDVLANVAGGSYGAEHMRLMDFNLADWRRIFDLNLTSVFLCARAVVPIMRAQGSGAIVNVSSSAGVRGEPGYFEDVEAANARYEQYPIPRLGDPAEVASVICFLASDDSSYVTGETHLITGASTLAP